MSQNSVASVTPANSNLESPRQDKSLGVLASKFVELLREQKGILNLKHATEVLEVVQKRRIYDITNVLEGIGILEKDGKNTVKLRDERLLDTDDGNSQHCFDKLEELHVENQELKDQELILDREIRLIKKSYQQTKKDKELSSYAYITQEDFLDAFTPDDTILVIQNPINLEIQLCNRETSDSSSNFLRKLDVNCVDLNYAFKLRLSASDEKLDMRLVEPKLPDVHNIKNVNELMDELKIDEEDMSDEEYGDNIENIDKGPAGLKSPPSYFKNVPTLLKRSRTFENLSALDMDSKAREEIARKIFTKKSRSRISKFQKIKQNLRHVKLNRSSFTKVNLPVDSFYLKTLKPKDSICDLFDIVHNSSAAPQNFIQPAATTRQIEDIELVMEYSDSDEMEVEYLDEAYLSD